MVLLEMSITPLGKGESVSQYVAECVELIDRSGLDYELHAMGTIVEGELAEVLDLMRRCIEQVADAQRPRHVCRQARFSPRRSGPHQEQSGERGTEAGPQRFTKG